MNFKNRDIIKISDFSREEITFVLDETEALRTVLTAKSPKKEYESYTGLLTGDRLISAFFEDSTRTRTSFIEAIRQLGGKHTGFAGPQGTSLNKNESIKHTLQMFQNYNGNVIVVRHSLEGTPQFLADTFDIPVINAGDGTNEHPTQAFLDLYSIKRTQGRLEHLNIVMIGDLKYGRTTHSLVTGLSLFPGNTFYFISPSFLSMPKKFLELLDERGCKYYTSTNINDFLASADIIYVTRVQQERLPEDVKANYDKIKKEYQFTAALLDQVKSSMRIMHPLPIDKKVQEITSDVDSDPHAYYIAQAENGLYVRMTLLGLVLGKISSPEFVYVPPVVEPTNFVEVEIHPKISKDRRIDYITNGIVIDHLPPHSAKDVYTMMGYDAVEEVFLAMGLPSDSLGRKDMIKIESVHMTLDDLESLNRIALKYPGATINLVKDKVIIRKGKVRLPSEIHGMIRCPNGKCVSRPEYMESVPAKFYVRKREPLLLECHYCQTRFGCDDLYFT